MVTQQNTTGKHFDTVINSLCGHHQDQRPRPSMPFSADMLRICIKAGIDTRALSP